MRKYLFILIASIGTAYGQRSPTSDTLCFDIPTIKKILIAGEQGKVLKQQVVILNDRITLLQGMVGTLETKDSVTVASYEAQIKTMQEERKIFEDQIKTFEKLLKREKFRRKLTAGAGILATGIAVYLGTK